MEVYLRALRLPADDVELALRYRGPDVEVERARATCYTVQGPASAFVRHDPSTDILAMATGAWVSTELPDDVGKVGTAAVLRDHVVGPGVRLALRLT